MIITPQFNGWRIPRTAVIPPTLCEGLTQFSDNFNDNSIAPFWTVFATGAIAVQEVNNQLEITPTPSTEGYAQIISTPVCFEGHSVQADFVQVIGGDNTSGGNTSAILIKKDIANLILLGKDQGGTNARVTFEVRIAGVSTFHNIYGTTPPGPTGSFGNDRWRIRMDGNLAICEEWNGSIFVNKSSQVIPWDLSNIRISLECGYYLNVNGSSQKGIFDNIISDATY